MENEVVSSFHDKYMYLDLSMTLQINPTLTLFQLEKVEVESQKRRKKLHALQERTKTFFLSFCK